MRLPDSYIIKLALTKSSTPFLSDLSEEICERFATPPPSTWGLSSPVHTHAREGSQGGRLDSTSGKFFEYPRFPVLQQALLGQVS